MNIAIISGSNVASSGQDSISMRTGKMLSERLQGLGCEYHTDIIDLRDYQLVPCSMCEACAETGSCVKDEDYNKLLDAVQQADELIIICPHYAPIPSKLIILFEKLEEMSYLQYCAGTEAPHPTNGKKAGIIAHGGMIQDYEKLYKENILTPLINVMECIGMKVVNRLSNEDICFGVKGFEKSQSKITHDIIYDMDRIEQALDNFMDAYGKA